MKLLKGWWRWFGSQSRLNKVVIVGFSSSLVLFLIPVVVSWFKPPPIHVGVAFYTYERAFILEGNTKTYIYENRNLVSDCRLRLIEQAVPKNRAKTPDPQSWVLIKFLLENVSDQYETFPLKISRINAMKILNRETVLRTGEETFADEKIEFMMLRSDEPDLKDEDQSYRLLPKARVCPEGTAGDW